MTGCGGEKAPPAAPTPAPAPAFEVHGEPGGDLVLALHGVGGSAATPEFTAEVSGLTGLAGREGFAVVYPDGEGDWDEDDLPELRRILDEVPHQRAFAIGCSGGGFMVHRLACELSDRLDAIAVLHAPLIGRCRPSRPVAVLQIVGTADDVIPPGGGTTPDGARTPPVAKAMARWRELNGGRARVKLVRVRDGGHEWYPDASETAWRFFAAGG